MKMELHVHNIEITLRYLKDLGPRGAQGLDDTMCRAMNLDLYPAWVKQISFTDHSLQDLARLGHPYSKRYSKDSFVHPDDVVHIQDGALLAGSSIRKTDRGYDLVNTTPEYVYLRYGKGRMRMRDPGGEAMRLALPAIRKRFITEFSLKGNLANRLGFKVS